MEKKVFISMHPICARALLDLFSSQFNARVLERCHHLFSSRGLGKVDVVGGVANSSWEGSNVGCTGGLGDVSWGDSRSNSYGGNVVGQRSDSWETRVGETWEPSVSEGRKTMGIGGDGKLLVDRKSKSISVRVAAVNRNSCPCEESGG